MDTRPLERIDLVSINLSFAIPSKNVTKISLDVYRAANHILRMTLEGKITLSFLPPNYDQNVWENHPHLVQIRELLGLGDQHAEGEQGKL